MVVNWCGCVGLGAIVICFGRYMVWAGVAVTCGSESCMVVGL